MMWFWQMANLLNWINRAKYTKNFQKLIRILTVWVSQYLFFNWNCTNLWVTEILWYHSTRETCQKEETYFWEKFSVFFALFPLNFSLKLFVVIWTIEWIFHDFCWFRHLQLLMSYVFLPSPFIGLLRYNLHYLTTVLSWLDRRVGGCRINSVKRTKMKWTY